MAQDPPPPPPHARTCKHIHTDQTGVAQPDPSSSASPCPCCTRSKGRDLLHVMSGGYGFSDQTAPRALFNHNSEADRGTRARSAPQLGPHRIRSSARCGGKAAGALPIYAGSIRSVPISPFPFSPHIAASASSDFGQKAQSLWNGSENSSEVTSGQPSPASAPAPSRSA